MAVIITVGSQKGGVGKTSTCASLGHGLARAGRRVLLIDCDPQGQLAIVLGGRQDSGVFDLLVSQIKPDQLVRSTNRDRLEIIPGDARTATAQVVLSAENRPITYLEDRLKPVLNHYDFCLIDTSPSIGNLQGMALHAADLVLIPAAVDFLAVEGASALINTVKQIKENYNWRGGLAILPTFYDEATNESRVVLADLRERYAGGVIDLVIHRATILREAAAYGQTCFELDSKSRAAVEYQALTDYILGATKGR